MRISGGTYLWSFSNLHCLSFFFIIIILNVMQTWISFLCGKQIGKYFQIHSKILLLVCIPIKNILIISTWLSMFCSYSFDYIYWVLKKYSDSTQSSKSDKTWELKKEKRFYERCQEFTAPTTTCVIPLLAGFLLVSLIVSCTPHLILCRFLIQKV